MYIRTYNVMYMPCAVDVKKNYPNTNVSVHVVLLCLSYIKYMYITRYGSTLYIGIGMVFVFSPYIRKFSSYFHFQVILTFNDFIALNV